MTCYGIIYLITNTVNGKRYVGQTTRSLSERKKDHLTSRCNRYLRRSFRKHGREAFHWNVLKEASSQEVLDRLEDQFILCFNTLDRRFGYNLRRGGGNGRLADEVRERMAEAKRGTRHTEATKHKISASLKNLLIWAGVNNPRFGRGDEITGAANPMFGRRHTEEARRIMSANRRGIPGLSGAANPMFGKKSPNSIRLSVWQDGVFKGTFKSMCDAALALGCHPSRISRAFAGKRPMPRGLVLKEEQNDEVVA